jgi:hypothetical protein
MKKDILITLSDSLFSLIESITLFLFGRSLNIVIRWLISFRP